jgi:hypothetical protein
VLTQAARLLLFAIEPPDDDTQLIVGTEKANAPPAHRQPSTGKWHAITRAAQEVWAIEEITATGPPPRMHWPGVSAVTRESSSLT